MAVRKTGFGKHGTDELSNKGGFGSQSTTPMTTQQKLAVGLQLASAIGLNPSSGGTGDTGTGAIGGGLEGGLSAAIASGGNPFAAAAGAVLGGVTGGLKARAARKAGEARAEAQKQESLRQIEADTESKRQNAIQNLSIAFQNSLLRR